MAFMRKPQAQTAAFTSPERAELAAKIADVREAEARRAALSSAYEKAAEACYAANAAVDRAQEVAAQAQKFAVEHAVSAALGEGGSAPLTPREAREALQEAKDYLEVARGARDTLHQAVEKAEAPYGKMALRGCAIEVVRTEARGYAVSLADEVEVLQRSLTRKGSELVKLFGLGVFATNDFGGPADPKIAAVVRRLAAISGPNWDLTSEQNAGVRQWTDAIADLEQDAAAVLPVR